MPSRARPSSGASADWTGSVRGCMLRGPLPRTAVSPVFFFRDCSLKGMASMHSALKSRKEGLKSSFAWLALLVFENAVDVLQLCLLCWGNISSPVL